MTGSRVILYALSDKDRGAVRHVAHALRGLRPHAERLVVLAPGRLTGPAVDDIRSIADRVREFPGETFRAGMYLDALDELGGLSSGEVVLTGDSWFGPVREFGPVLDRLARASLDLWQMIEHPGDARPSFPREGFPAEHRSWLWSSVRAEALASPRVREFWSRPEHDRSEPALLAWCRSHGLRVDVAFDASTTRYADPGLYASEQLLDEGAPFVERAVFAGYPPFLDRHAIFPADVAETMREYGYPADVLKDALVRSIAPKALYANTDLLSVVSPEPETDPGDPTDPQRIAALVHMTDLEGLDEVLLRLGYLPATVHVVMTTTHGRSAAVLERRMENWVAGTDRTFEIRVTPSNPGRDMSDLFVASRDILRSGAYDLIVKIHSRPAWWKTINRRRYFRRYQYENLLDSAGHFRAILRLFREDPTLGLVFPPMINIGHGTMGNGWAYLREPAERLAERIGINVPFDEVSPLAPYGGMWIGRPEALRLLSEQPWSFVDYGRRYERRYRHLARLQERLVVLAAAELGYGSRTVLSPAHAAISHTALDFKADQLFSTTHGWPVEQIGFLHRAGYTGYGGPVALTRMYLRINHPRLVTGLRPLYRVLYAAFRFVAPVRRVIVRALGRGEE